MSPFLSALAYRLRGYAIVQHCRISSAYLVHIAPSSIQEKQP